MALMDIFKKKQQPETMYPMPGGVMPAGMPANMPPMMGEQMPPPMPSDVPIAQVVSMQNQGLSNNQIIQGLQRQGFQATQIYDALAQAEARKSIEPMEVQGETAPQRTEMRPPTHPESEALVEQIIEEKWQDLQKDLGKINEWKDLLTSRIDKLEQGVLDMRTDLDGLHKAIVARIGEYDKTLMDVGTEIKAMEKVFQKVLPELTGNIQELSRITKNVKK
jgi:DNA-binding transcriptional MerR regulator